jgi:hypothetical protein
VSFNSCVTHAGVHKYAAASPAWAIAFYCVWHGIQSSHFQTSSRVSQSRWEYFFFSPNLKFCNRQHVFIELCRSLAIRKTQKGQFPGCAWSPCWQAITERVKAISEGEEVSCFDALFFHFDRRVQAVKETQGRHWKNCFCGRDHKTLWPRPSEQVIPHGKILKLFSLSRPLLKSFYNMNKQPLNSKESASSKTVSEHAWSSESRNKR